MSSELLNKVKTVLYNDALEEALRFDIAADLSIKQDMLNHDDDLASIERMDTQIKSKERLLEELVSLKRRLF